jgi:hypothetical protein
LLSAHPRTKMESSPDALMSWQPELSDSPDLAGYQRPLTAGGLSLIAHLVLIIAGALLWQTSPRMALEEGERPVSIVLASSQAASSETEYFDETESASAAASSAPASAPSGATESGLPGSAQLPVSSAKIALPGDIAPLVEGIALPTATTSGGGSGKATLDPSETINAILAEEAKRPRGPSGPVGPQGEVGIFGTAPTRGHSFVFLIDRSHSMGSEGLGAIAAAQAELLAALEKLESNHSFQIVAYNQAPTYFRERKLIAIDDDSRRAGRDFLATLPAFGSTDHERAIVSALQLKPDVMYLLTDGDPVLNASQRKRIREESGGRTTICCIQFGRIRPDDEATRTALQALARENRGSYVFVDMNKR